jgi:alpha-1,3/alpha-1,6-mannosyltransferase
VFYCHFPDQLLTQRQSVLKALYRKPIDWFEEKTTGMADTVLVNSNFTGEIFCL